MAQSIHASTDVKNQSVQVLSDMITFRTTSEDTAGAYTMVETTTRPGGGTPPHLHRRDTEAFYVLEGTYTFKLGDEVIQHGPGGYVFIPIGTIHSFENTGESTARMLIMNSPGGLHEGFFKEIGVPIEDLDNRPTVDIEKQIARVMEAAPKYGIELLPPPESQE